MTLEQIGISDGPGNENGDKERSKCRPRCKLLVISLFAVLVVVCLVVGLWYGVSAPTSVSAVSVCYPDLGCFNSTLSCHQTVTPESPAGIQTRFRLYTPESPSVSECLDAGNNASINASSFRADRETKITIHGFNDEGVDETWLAMKDMLLSIGAFNVIIVDWNKGAEFIDLENLASDPAAILSSYSISRQNTRVVGRQVGQLTEKLVLLKGAKYSTIHLVGHSLGAHAAGYAGESVSGQYGRITGLDPAGPEFEEYSEPGCLLEKTDALFVDIIHTDDLFGNGVAVGHQDFYSSGGLNQVSCGPVDHACDHGKAVEFFYESITTECLFLAYPCSSWTDDFLQRDCRECGDVGCPRMGYYANLSLARGTFMLGTAMSEPFCLSDAGVPPPA